MTNLPERALRVLYKLHSRDPEGYLNQLKMLGHNEEYLRQEREALACFELYERRRRSEEWRADDEYLRILFRDFPA